MRESSRPWRPSSSGAQEVADGAQLEGALERTRPLLAADPGGAQAEVAELAAERRALAADLRRGRRARASGCAETRRRPSSWAFFEVVAFGGGREGRRSHFEQQGASWTHGYSRSDHARPIGLAAGNLGKRSGSRPTLRRCRRVAPGRRTGTWGTSEARRPTTSNLRTSRLLCEDLSRRSKRFEFT